MIHPAHNYGYNELKELLEWAVADGDVRAVDHGDQWPEKARNKLFDCVRPDGNMLPGYKPTPAVQRVLSQ